MKWNVGDTTQHHHRNRPPSPRHLQTISQPLEGWQKQPRLIRPLPQRQRKPPVNHQPRQPQPIRNQHLWPPRAARLMTRLQKPHPKRMWRRIPHQMFAKERRRPAKTKMPNSQRNEALTTLYTVFECDSNSRAVKRFSVLVQAYVLHRNLGSEPVKPLEQRPTVRLLHSQTEE